MKWRTLSSEQERKLDRLPCLVESIKHSYGRNFTNIFEFRPSLRWIDVNRKPIDCGKLEGARSAHHFLPTPQALLMVFLPALYVFYPVS